MAIPISKIPGVFAPENLKMTEKTPLILDKLTVFDLSGFQIFSAVELHFYADSIFAANPVNFFLQRIGYTAVFFEILHQFPGFIDKKSKLLPTFTAAYI